MKLIYCLNCKDIVKLDYEERKCKCESSGGKYLSSGLYAEIWGNCIPLGINNSSLKDGIQYVSNARDYWSIEAFLINEDKCNTIERISK